MDFFWGKASMSYSEPMVGWWPFLIRDSRIGYQLYMYYCVYNNKVLYSLILYQKNITYKVLYFNGKIQQIIYVHLHMSRNSCPHHTNHCCSHQRTIFFYWILGLTTLRPFHTYPLQNQHRKPGKLDFKDYTPQKNDWNMFSFWVNIHERTIKLWRFIPCNKPFLSASSILTKEVCMAQARASAQMVRHPCGWFLKCMVAGVKSGFELSWKQQFAGKMRKCHINRKPRLRFFSKIKIYLQNHARPISLKLQLVFWRQGIWKKMTNFPGIIKHNSMSWGGVTCRSGPATKNKHPVEAPCPNLIHILWLSSDLRCRKPGRCVRRSYKKTW